MMEIGKNSDQTSKKITIEQIDDSKIITYRENNTLSFLFIAVYIIISVITFNIDVQAGVQFNRGVRIVHTLVSIPVLVSGLVLLIMRQKIVLGNGKITRFTAPINLFRNSSECSLENIVMPFVIENRMNNLLHNGKFTYSYDVLLALSEGRFTLANALDEATAIFIAKQILPFINRPSSEPIEKKKKLDIAGGQSISKPEQIYIQDIDSSTRIVGWYQRSTYMARIYDQLLPQFIGFGLCLLFSFFLMQYIGLDMSTIVFVAGSVMMFIFVIVFILLKVNFRHEIKLSPDNIVFSEKLLTQKSRQMLCNQMNHITSNIIYTKQGNNILYIDISGMRSSDLVVYHLLRITDQAVADYIENVLKNHVAQNPRSPIDEEINEINA